MTGVEKGVTTVKIADDILPLLDVAMSDAAAKAGLIRPDTIMLEATR